MRPSESTQTNERRRIDWGASNTKASVREGGECGRQAAIGNTRLPDAGAATGRQVEQSTKSTRKKRSEDCLLDYLNGGVKEAHA